VTGDVMTDYHAHPEFRALLDTVLANPADDAPRWVIADWVEEHGDDDRAAFIRLQLRAAAAGADMSAEDFARLGVLAFAHHEWHALRRPFTWLSGARPALVFQTNAGAAWQFTRGFVSAFRGPCHLFMRHALEMFTAHPITEVALTDRRPLVGVRGDGEAAGVWLKASANERRTDDGSHLPDVLFNCLIETMFPGGAAACSGRTARHSFESLPVACIRYGRILAGLPPLPVR
jgi:uncharacterized protein (TIGR02996 family)